MQHNYLSHSQPFCAAADAVIPVMQLQHLSSGHAACLQQAVRERTWLQRLWRAVVLGICRPAERQHAGAQQLLRRHREALVKAHGRHEQPESCSNRSLVLLCYDNKHRCPLSAIALALWVLIGAARKKQGRHSHSSDESSASRDLHLTQSPPSAAVRFSVTAAAQDSCWSGSASSGPNCAIAKSATC